VNNTDIPSGGGLDENLQREIDEALGDQSVEELLAQKLPPAKADEAGEAPQRGQVRHARVVSIDRQAVLVELGGKDQGMVPLSQFANPPETGDVIELQVVRYDRDEDLWVLSRQGAVEQATWDELEVGTIVDAFVEKSNKGGLEVRFNRIKAFMPVSQISMYRVENPDDYVGSRLRCQVIEFNPAEKRVIVSARAVAELEAERRKEQLLEEIAEGDVREGIVRQVMPYGAFVDLGGIDGLVHVSELSHQRVEKPEEVVKAGQAVQVKVLKIDRENDRISLSMKQIGPDPWDSVADNYAPGSKVAGRVINLQNFGAFVEVEPGLEALIPISELTWSGRVRHPSSVLEEGQTVEAVVLEVDPERRRMSLSIKQMESDPWAGASERFPAGSEQTGTVKRIADFGAFVEVAPGVEGLVHISELSDQHTRRVEDAVQVGQTVKARVLEVDEEKRRISLTMKSQSAAATPEPEPERPKKKRKRPLRGGLD
jgi:small subunit ribosomal protein S1